MTEMCARHHRRYLKIKTWKLATLKTRTKEALIGGKKKSQHCWACGKHSQINKGQKTPRIKMPMSLSSRCCQMKIEMKEQGGYDRSADQIRRKIKKLTCILNG